jgi:hypothetical protein
MTTGIEDKKWSIEAYHQSLDVPFVQIVEHLFKLISTELPDAERKLWHAHPVWFLDGNPIVGYSMQKKGLRLMFWSGADFNEEVLDVVGRKYRDASVFFNSITDFPDKELQQCLRKARAIQWDYKNIVKRKGKLLRLI